MEAMTDFANAINHEEIKADCQPKPTVFDKPKRKEQPKTKQLAN